MNFPNAKDVYIESRRLHENKLNAQKADITNLINSSINGAKKQGFYLCDVLVKEFLSVVIDEAAHMLRENGFEVNQSTPGVVRIAWEHIRAEIAAEQQDRYR